MANTNLPSKFGLSADQLAELERLERTANDNEAGCSWIEKCIPEKTGFRAELMAGILFWTILWLPFLIGLLVTPIIQCIARVRLRRHRKFHNFRMLQQALIQHERAKRDFWLGLSGVSFEQHLADLYRRHGYDAILTRCTGDAGIDIFLARSGRRIIVQCKRHGRPVGPAVARELYGSLIASGADSAILASTSGFTAGVYDFFRGQSIELIDVESIVEMQEQINLEPTTF